jgi:hypothetical protein
MAFAAAEEEAMTRKKQIVRLVNRLDDDVSFDQVIYHLTVMRDIEVGMEQIQRGEVIDHDEVFDKLLAEDGQEKAGLVRPRQRQPQGDKAPHRAAIAKNGPGVRQTPKKPRE